MSKELTIHSLAENEAIIDKGLNTFYEVGNALTEIRDNKQYKSTHSTFEDYCIERWGIKRTYAYELMKSSKVIDNLSGIPDKPETEGQANELAKAQPEEQAKVWQQAQEETGKEQPTAQEIKAVVTTGNVHVSNNSGENEWYTPIKFIDAARAVLGVIDFDPASSELANETVNAIEFCTKDNSGLDKEWHGNVWMNPPYAQPLMSQFAEKAVNELANINQAIILVNNATETKWFQFLAINASAICFPSSRIKFIDRDGKPSGAPLQGQSFLYFGSNSNLFKRQFKQFGFVLIHG